MAKTLNTAELAARLETTPRTLRKFLRDDARANDLPIAGKGARWSIEARKVASLRKRFGAWSKAQEEARKAREAKREEAQAPEVVEELEDAPEAPEGPTDADLADIDAEGIDLD